MARRKMDSQRDSHNRARKRMALAMAHSDEHLLQMTYAMWKKLVGDAKEDKAQNVASSLLQSRFRGTKARKAVKKTQERADACERLVFGSMASHKEKLLRKSFAAFFAGLQEKRAAIFLQNRIRGKLARNKMAKEKNKKQRQEHLVAMSLGRGAHVLMRRVFDHMEARLVEKAVEKIRVAREGHQTRKNAFFTAAANSSSADLQALEMARPGTAETNDSYNSFDWEEDPGEYELPVPSKEFYTCLHQLHKNGTCLVPATCRRLSRSQYSELFRLSRVFVCQSPELQDVDIKAMLLSVFYDDTAERQRTRSRTASDMELRQLQTELMDTTLQELSLCNCDIGALGAEALGGAISNARGAGGALNCLQTLNLYGNKLGNKGVALLAAAFVNPDCVRTLKSVFLESNFVGDVGGCALAEMLKHNTTIQKLLLSGNSLSDLAADHLAQALLTNRTLTSLVLDRNMITNAGATLLAKGTSTRDNPGSALQHLSLNANPRVGNDGARSCCTSISH
jgi:hypothetical protein